MQKIYLIDERSMYAYSGRPISEVEWDIVFAVEDGKVVRDQTTFHDDVDEVTDAETVAALEQLVEEALGIYEAKGADTRFLYFKYAKEGEAESWHLTKPLDWVEVPAACRCGNCGRELWESSLLYPLSELEDLAERLTTGGVVPSGECPYCDCLIYPIEPVKEISTVNVITMNCGQVSAMKSWPDNDEGAKAAERYFKQAIIAAGCPADEVDDATEDGIYEAEPTGRDIIIAHSC